MLRGAEQSWCRFMVVCSWGGMCCITLAFLTLRAALQLLNADGGDATVLKPAGSGGCTMCCCRGICGCSCPGRMCRCGTYIGPVVVTIVGAFG